MSHPEFAPFTYTFEQYKVNRMFKLIDHGPELEKHICSNTTTKHNEFVTRMEEIITDLTKRINELEKNNS